MRHTLIILAGLFTILSAGTAEAFCGFYVGGGGAKLFNNATVVVMMREGTRTVLSMQNNYEGPPKDFAMVVPVPVVLQKKNVKTLQRDVFDRVDRLAAPRLVEYWEMDPCLQYRQRRQLIATEGSTVLQSARASARGYGVKIEAQFTVGEYEIVILSASDSTGLDRWLQDHGYKIPQGAEPVLRPYVQQGMKFFVAKVDVQKVKKVDGHAMLSPLRFHYDTPHFSLPVRLGLLNSSGTQDLIVHILARGQRYEVANYPNVTIPTNLELAPEAKEHFGELYVALFDQTLRDHPGSVITEYAWSSGKCDPCPGPTLSPGDLITLGLDALPVFKDTEPMRARGLPTQFVLTRLHARYSKDTLGQDLVFQAAPPITGGRETGGPETNEQGAQPSAMNQFQGRYIIRHSWTGPIECENPVRGRWGGRPGQPYGQNRPVAAQNLAFVPRGQVQVKGFLSKTMPDELSVMRSDPSGKDRAGGKGVVRIGEAPEPPPGAPGKAAEPGREDAVPPESPPAENAGSGCAGCRLGAQPTPPTGIALGFVLAGAWIARRRRRNRRRLGYHLVSTRSSSWSP